jgi:hypothetical protein
MEVSGQLHAPATLFQVKSPWYPFDRTLGGTQNQSGRGGEEKNSHSFPGLETLIIKPVAQRCTTELSWLLIHTFQKINSEPEQAKTMIMMLSSIEIIFLDQIWFQNISYSSFRPFFPYNGAPII